VARANTGTPLHGGSHNLKEKHMKEKIITEIINEMLPVLNNKQLKKLQDVLEINLYNVVIVTKNDEEPHKDTLDYLEMFLSAKRIEGCSEKTLVYYRNTICRMIDSIGKTVCTIETEDLRTYLSEYQAEKESSKVTIDNMRRIFSSFFAWLEDEDYIIKSPVRRIHRIKSASVIKETYTDEQLETMRDNCENLRDLAMIDILASTGMRVGELVLLNRDDISFDERECIVFGKGDKERMVYFDARTKLHLQNYLEARTDNDNALFVSLKAPYRRMQIGGIELRLREMGKRLNIDKVHPHKFRRTLATVAIDKGMPIEQLQKLLGHQRIDTTLQYAMVKQSNVKIAHRKYIG
jgi:integrase/recombinase XerD